MSTGCEAAQVGSQARFDRDRRRKAQVRAQSCRIDRTRAAAAAAEDRPAGTGREPAHRRVHFLEAHDTPVPEAAGVQTLLQGAARRSTSDDELLGEAEKTFDLLYEAYFEPPNA